MTAKKTIYWVATTLIALETLAGGVTDLRRGKANVLSGPRVAGVLRSLGYPEYLLDILAFWKVPGAMVLLAPRFPRLKEWAYAGIFFELTGAAASHAIRRHRARDIVTPLILAGLAVASWALRPPSRTLGAEAVLPTGIGRAPVTDSLASRSLSEL
jgi:DoxX-like protein